MLVVIKGAGDLASGIAVRLFRAGFPIVMTDIAYPTAIRRTVSFCPAVVSGTAAVEGITAHRAENAAEAREILSRGEIPVLADPEANIVRELSPEVVVDAVLAKYNTGTGITDAPVVIGVGPGFTVGEDCHAVVETERGHDLGRVLLSGSAAPNTGKPGNIAGYTVERILRAPADGVFRQIHDIGDHVEAGEVCGTVAGEPMRANISGVLRGILTDGCTVHKGMKSGDVDPRDRLINCFTVSDKARAVGGGVLEAILQLGGFRFEGFRLPRGH